MTRTYRLLSRTARKRQTAYNNQDLLSEKQADALVAEVIKKKQKSHVGNTKTIR